MSSYSDLIRETIKDALTDIQIEEVEDILRNVIFHSTLDWQTKAQLQNGIRKAYKVFLVVEEEKKS